METLRYIGSRAAAGKSRQGQIRIIVANDVARAYVNAPSTSAPAKLCEEDRGPEDEGMCGKLSVSMCDTRFAVRTWQTRYTDLVCNCGFRVARGNTCTFGHQQRDIVVMVHVDVFVSTAHIEDLRCLFRMPKDKFEIATDIIGYEGESQKQLKTGPSPSKTVVRHSEMIVKELRLQGSERLSTPV